MIRSRKVKWAGYAAQMVQRRDACRLLVVKPERNRPPGRPKHWWTDNINIELREVRWSCMDWINLA
jgi:hypothetical protein